MFKKAMLILLSISFLIVGCTNETGNRINSEMDIEDYIKIFYSDSQAMYWLIEEEKIAVNPKVIVEYLIACEKTSIPKNTDLLSLEVKDNVAYVNLSKEFECFEKGDLVISINMGTIVHTLCLNESLNINKVVFLLEGDRVTTIGANDNTIDYSSNLKLLEIGM